VQQRNSTSSLLFSTLIGVGTLVLADCSAIKASPCGPATCSGCCDENQNCQTGNLDSVCGQNGEACTDCTTVSKACLASSCQSSGLGNDGGGSGNDAGVCTGKCSAPAITCDGTSAYQTCVQFSATCWDWVYGTCPAGSACFNGVCVYPDAGCGAACTGADSGSALPDAGEDAGETVDGGAMDAGECSCPGGMICSNGMCQCASECTAPGYSRCYGTDIQVCVVTDAGCQDWENFACGSADTCQNARCVGTPAVNVGGPCRSDPDCGAAGECVVYAPQGYCVSACPNTSSLSGAYYCPSDSTCVAFGSSDGGSEQLCLESCPNPLQGQSTCRTDYVCGAVIDPFDAGAVAGVCIPNCNWFDAADAGGSAAYCHTGTRPDGGPVCQPSGYCR
jgi:hypothetical protein